MEVWNPRVGEVTWLVVFENNNNNNNNNNKIISSYIAH